MADQGKWFKLWCASLDDAHLENLELDDWARWARLGAYIKRHGSEGKITFSSPARALTNLFRVPDLDAAIMIIKRFPNVRVGERSEALHPVTLTTVTCEIEYTNWSKFQWDFSNDRVRKFRDKKRHAVTAQEEKRSRRRRDVEEKRREVSPLPPTKFQKPTSQEVTAYAASIGFRLDGEKFCAFYESKGWLVGKSPMKDWRAAVVTWKKDAHYTAMIQPPKPKTQDPKPEDCISADDIKNLSKSLCGVIPK
jgi:hypothetical protein